jgi:hypothetical protein
MNDGSRCSFDIESCQDIDRKIQNKMFEQPALRKWGIFYCEMDKRVAVQFMETMMKCTETFGYEVMKPREFAVRGNRFSEWETMIKQNINPSVQAVVLLLPG